MNNCKCDNCKYCTGYLHNTRKSFHCNHPNYEYILNYFEKNKIGSMPGFIGFSENFKNIPKRKTTPKWCPEQEE